MAYKLLLADDSITIQKVVELVLAEEDFQIKSVSNGDDALNLLGSFRPDIVLADIEMPKVNGYNLCEKIKKNPLTAHVPVILLAGAFEPVDEELARQVGADDTVIKPFESQELISKINAALAMGQAEPADDIFGDHQEILAVVEEAEISAEPQNFGVEEAGVEAEGLAEDLWSMDEVPEVAEELTAEAVPEEVEAEAVSGEQVAEKAFESIFKETPSASAFKPEVIMEEKAVRPGTRGPLASEVEVPSKEEFLREFAKVVDTRIGSVLSGIDIREALLASLLPSLKDAVEKVLWEVAPELAEKVLKEILKSTVSSLTTEVEKVIWETVPDLAQTMIAREIEKIKSQF